MAEPMSKKPISQMRESWQAKWAEALRLWSIYTQLSPPRWCMNDAEADQQGLETSFAMIRLTDQAIVVNLDRVQQQGLVDYPLEILGHEIGHHILCPANLTDQAWMIAYMRRALPGKEHQADMVANLYADLLINDRLKRVSELRMEEVYQILLKANAAVSPLWHFYMRIYEILWSLTRGTLTAGEIPAAMEGDAYLGSRLVRVFRDRWLAGAGRFAALCLAYLDEAVIVPGRGLGAWRDTKHAGAGAVPHGLTGIDSDEIEGAIHPAFDPEITGDNSAAAPRDAASSQAGTDAQHRQPFEYGQILKALGLDMDDHQIAIQYYRERAMRHLIPFPSRQMPESQEPLMEGLAPWEFGQPIESVDWEQSVLYSPRIVPGVTTLQRTWGVMAGSEADDMPLDLDLYVDCSGSMPNPQRQISYTTLAGAVLVLSALRAGARVQATLWSGPGQFDTTHGFIRDEQQLLGILTGYLGGATAFPLHVLRETYQKRTQLPRPTHILVISDAGVDSMFQEDEMGRSGHDLVAEALEMAGAGCTLALNISPERLKTAGWVTKAQNLGLQIFAVSSWKAMVAFARNFSRMTYGR